MRDLLRWKMLLNELHAEGDKSWGGFSVGPAPSASDFLL